MTKVKAWAKSQGRLVRRVAIRDERIRILIVCEGKKTEPLYFKGFRITSVNLVIEPAGAIHTSVVSKAIDILQEDSDYEEVWCVFDRDKHPSNRHDLRQFNDAIQLAQHHGIKVAYSNDAFELWYLLHFGYYDTQMTRMDYISKLSRLLPGGYQKNDPNMYTMLEGRMDDAIRNAKRLYDMCDKNDPGNADPSTTVFILVERLRQLQ